MNNYIIREVANSYDSVCRFLCDRLNYEIIDLLLDDSVKSIQSKQAGARNGLRAIKEKKKKKRTIKNADTIMFIGNYGTLYLMLMNRMGIIKPKSIMWWGFFVHSTKVQKVLRLAFKILYKENVKFILFSECEQVLYSKNLGLPKGSFISIPYGDWSNNGIDTQREEKGDYYFAGGYSNRDYKALLRVWNESISQHLVVIGSRNNADLVEFESKNTNPLIEILYDTTSDEFDEKLKHAKACIMPFKENTGASGQSVTLRCMRSGIMVIATDTDIMREYVTNGKSGFLFADIESELPGIINKIEHCEIDIENMIDRQEEIFMKRFSHQAITKKLVQAIQNP